MIAGREKRQFRRLFAGFTWRFLDNELMSAEGEPAQSFIQALALLGGLNISTCLMIGMKYWFWMENVAPRVRLAAVWSDIEFFVSLSMAAAGAVAVLTWDAVFPDRREAVILTALPLRMRTVFGAKLASILLVYGAVTLAANAFSMVLLPWLALGDRITLVDTLRWWAGNSAALFGGSGFVLFSFLGIQAILISLLPYRAFQRASALVQFAALFGILALFVLMPPIASPEGLQKNAGLALRLPPLWFLGLAEYCIGSREPIVLELARRALLALSLSVSVALAAYAAGYQRHVRRMIEMAEGIGGSVIRHRILDRLIALLAARPVERAVFRFTLRSMARNRRPRLLFAVYCGVGVAWVMGGVLAALRRAATPSTELTAPPIVLAFFILLGMRMLFAVPVELNANWVFRLIENRSAKEHFAAIRKMMFLFGVLPLAILPAPVYVWLWGAGIGLRHTFLVLLLALYLRERILRDFDKIPFTCSYLPGKIDMKLKFPVWLVLFSSLSFLVTNIERWCLTHPVAFNWFAGLVLLMFVLELRRRDPLERGFTFEERPDWMSASLELR